MSSGLEIRTARGITKTKDFMNITENPFVPFYDQDGITIGHCGDRGWLGDNAAMSDGINHGQKIRYCKQCEYPIPVCRCSPEDKPKCDTCGDVGRVDCCDDRDCKRCGGLFTADCKDC